MHKILPLQFFPLEDHHPRQGPMSSSHWERFHCNGQNVLCDLSSFKSNKSFDVCCILCSFQTLNAWKENEIDKEGKLRKEKNNDKEGDTYTKAPPALPNLVTLPFPNELLISFIAASNALCWNKTKGLVFIYSFSNYYAIYHLAIMLIQDCIKNREINK